MKRILSLLLCLALLSAAAPAALAADAGVTTDGTLVYIDMAGRTGDVALAGGSVASDGPASDLVAGAVAAINGGFFNSYYTGAGTDFPGNCPVIYGAVTKDGEVVNAGGDNNAIGFTYDGRVLIDRVTFGTTAVIAGKANVNVWGVNKLYDDAGAVTVLTDALTLPFTVPVSSRVFTVQSDKVTGAAGGGTYTVPKGAKLLIYHADAVANAEKWGILPAVGDKVQFAYTYAPKRTADQADWNNLKTAVTGGRMLVQGGVNVTADAAYNASFDGDPKQSNTGSALRSFAAVLKDGRLLLGTASGAFPQIADSLIAKGAVSAVSLDGGASSMLYTRDAGFLTPAGRELASALVIVPQNGAAQKPVMPEVPVIDNNPNQPSSWAAASIEEAKGLRLIPDWMLYGYRNPATRAEFCALLIQLIPARTGKTADQLRTDLGIWGDKFDAVQFSDTDLYNVRLAAALGIVTGYADGTFRPDSSITREQAAAMLQRTADLLGTVEKTRTPEFADETAISEWARSSVDYVTACGIMNGKGDNFDPRGVYTKEQAFLTMLNTYHAVTPN